MGTKFYKAQDKVCYRIIPKVKQGFLFFLLFFALQFSVFSQTNLTFTQLSGDFIAPGRGVQHWGTSNWDDVYVPTVPAGNVNPLNFYTRFNWTDIESSTTQGSYSWSIFDNFVNQAIDGGAMFSFGLMPMCSACGLSGYGYPTYMHNLMQSEGGNNVDWQNAGLWTPNWNSVNWKARYAALMRAVANHIATTSRNGKPFSSAFLGYDLRHYGDFGEGWGFSTGVVPTGRQITDATLMQMTDSAIAIFPNVQLSIPMNYIAPNGDYNNSSGNPGLQAAYYVLTATNSYGRIGWRRDNIGDDGYNAYLTGTTASYNSVPLLPLIMNCWQVAPIGGEPAAGTTAVTRCGTVYCDLHNENTLFHMSYMGNGNYLYSNSSGASWTQLVTNVRAGSAEQGYKLILTGGTMTTTLTGGSAFNLSLNWQNIGLAPVYENWNVVYELRKSDGTVVWTGNSSFLPKLFLPQTTPTTISDNFNLTAVAAGTYSMYLIIRDPVNYKKPLPLAITGRGVDGSYLLRNNITVGTGSGNQAPAANAGSNQTIQLPASTATLSGSGTDPDGTIASYTWTKVSGPSGGALTSATTASTNITGLIQGVYVYNLTVTDNLGAIGSASVQVTVNASGGSPFNVNAGPDQTLAAGVTTTTLAGTIPANIPPTSSGSDTINLIVIQGESNAAGNAFNDPLTAIERSSRSSVQIWDHNTNKFVNEHVPFNTEQDTYIDTSRHGLEVGLADEVDAGFLNNPTYLVKIGVSGSYICQWLPGSTCRGVGLGLWENWVIPIVDPAVAAIKAMGKPYRIIVWQSLGLNDRFGQGTTPATFMAGMAAFRAAFRSRYNNPTIRFLSTNFNNPPASTFDWSYVWDQMAASDPYFTNIPVYGATYVDNPASHFDYNGFKIIAHNMVDSMVSYGMGKSSGTGSPGTTYTSVWAKVSGPAGGAILSPSSANTNITGLAAGVYLYSLKVTDNLGNSKSDTIQITVNAAANQPPISNAGADQNITLPINSVTLNGSASSDPDGSITSYLWTKINGPAQFTIGNNATASTLLSNLTAGLYTFQLKVTDNGGAIALDTIKIVVNPAPVNQPPIANAGGDITITLPANVANLSGSASSDPDGTISAYAWSQVSGPSTATISAATSVNTGISGLQQGSYTFALKVTDNNGATGLDSVKVTVNPAANLPPVANAGVSKTITLPVNSTNLDGSLSNDPDGTISSYNWTQIAGPSTATISGAAASVATASSLVAGLYTFQLTVMDNNGATATATVKITVTAATPQPPIANAGADQTITLPVNSVTIDGSASSASSGSIVSYVWTETSGPSTVSLSNTVTNTLNNLQAGVYKFSLTITDNNAATGTDAVTITVNPAANQAPVANAGTGITLILPNNSTSLNGTLSTDPDGTISTYSWTRISGPSTPVITGANTATANISGLVVGTYVYSLTVTDNKGASSSAQVNVIVSPAANQIPVANAGPNQSITAPASTVILNGSASSDPDGTITAYNWVTISGPGSITISNSNTATPSVQGLMTGVYIFELTVTDNSGATAKDQVTVIVNPQAILPNQAPVANAGTNQTIVEPVNSTTLNGSSSFDPDGTISNYGWTQVSGPSTSVIAAGNTVSPTVSQLIVGQYVYQLTVTDNNGATNTDQVTITVNAGTSKLNIAPVASAGKTDTITLPTNTYTLDASGSTDPDGTIDSYQWQQISGPATASSSSMNSSQVALSNLVAGVYEFEVTVTDNGGATSTATMQLTVDQGFSLATRVSVFPNPANSTIHEKITSSIMGTVKVNVYDMNGRLVLSSQVEKTSDVIYEKMNVSSLAPGMYTIQINLANQKTIVSKFIKN